MILNRTIVAALVCLIVAHPLNAYASSEICMRTLESKLNNLKPTLVGKTIVLATGPDGHFTLGSDGTDERAQFYIGSVTKHMTAFLLLKSLSEWKTDDEIKQLLKLPLTDAFPGSPFLKSIDRPWLNQVTLLDLMTHRSGLSDYVAAYSERGEAAKLNQPVSAVDLIHSAEFDKAKPLAYSNTNYLILGKLAEEVTSKSFDALFDSLIAKPAGMADSFAPIEGNYHSLKSYKAFERLVPNLNESIFIDLGNALGAGNVVSTAVDMSKWGHYLRSKPNEAVWELMSASYGDDDGDELNLGLGTEATPYGQLVGHQGGLDSYHSFFGFLGEPPTEFVILSNHNKSFAVKAYPPNEDVELFEDTFYLKSRDGTLHYKLLSPAGRVVSGAISESQLQQLLGDDFHLQNDPEPSYFEAFTDAIKYVTDERGDTVKDDFEKCLASFSEWANEPECVEPKVAESKEAEVGESKDSKAAEPNEAKVIQSELSMPTVSATPNEAGSDAAKVGVSVEPVSPKP